jgi:hypothetical protein
MSINLIEKATIPLLVATILLGGFYWQFITIYTYIIEHFTTSKLSVIYTYLIIYSFLILILSVSFINFLNHFLLKSKTFITITIGTLLLFYALSYNVFVDLFRYFLSLPLEEDAFMGLILFTVMSFSYALYTLFIPFFSRFIPLVHVLLFTLLGLGYSVFFISSYGYPMSEILSKL